MKMKTILGLFCACISAGCFVSCSEKALDTENNDEKQLVDMAFSAGEDFKTKTTMANGTDIYFQESDAISIINADGNTKFTANKPEKYAEDPWPMPKADFVGAATVTEPYYAVYPYTEDAEISDGKLTGIVIPAEQEATEGTFDPAANASVCKATASKQLHFLNVGAYFEFKTDADYDKVVIISNTTEPIAGTVNVDPATGNVTDYVNVVNKITITNVKGGKTYYAVVLPAAMKNGISVQCFNGTESAGTVVTNASVTTNRAKIKKLGKITPTPVPPYETLSGEYTINSDGVKVRFAKGNLQYLAKDNKWRFAEHQWDVLGNSSEGGNTNPSESQTKWIDLFGWGCTGIQAEGKSYKSYQPWATDLANDTYYKKFNNADLSVNDGTDWGYVVSGKKTDYWFTLSQAEWLFILMSRTNFPAIAPEHRFALIKVNGIKCQIIFPDRWTSSVWPEGLKKPAFDTCGPDEKTYTEYTAEEGLLIEEKTGAAIFPVTGYRSGSTVNMTVYTAKYGTNDDVGYYHTRSNYQMSSRLVYTCAFGDRRTCEETANVGTTVPTGHEIEAKYGHAVRLVMIPKE